MKPIDTTVKRKVLIVDDHPLVREWLTSLINEQKDLVVCGEAATPPEAMQAVASSNPDVAIIDLSLGDFSGIDLIKNLKHGWPSLIVLVLSMHDESLYAERALRAGAKGYIMKRETTRNVIEAIRTVLEDKFYLSDTMAQTITTQFVEGRTLSTHSPAAQLTDRELVIFELLGQGRGKRHIAEVLGVSIKTVQAHCSRIKEKLHAGNATQLVREAVRHYELQTKTQK
jgi:DNA-binding NarL/FixJ family response regulator